MMIKKLYILVLSFLLVSCSGKLKNNNSDQENIIYPADAEAVIDMTKSPYHLDNTGEKDCSDAIIRALDDVLRPTRDRQKWIEEAVKNHPDTIIGFEINPRVGVIFPDRLEPSKILYFPNGTYKITKKIEYSLADLQNTRGAEINRQIHFQGQSEARTVFRLADHSPGFEEDKETPVISFMKGQHSNIAMSNTFENLTIDIGAGNPGAIGLHFYANNTGAVRHVTIRSSDKTDNGAIGLAILKGPVSGCLIKNLTVKGFDYGIKVTDSSIFTVFEHIQLKGQKKAGFWVVDNVVSIRGLRSTNHVPALQLTGEHGMVCLLDSELEGSGKAQSAIVFKGGYGYARNISTKGYAKSIETYRGDDVSENHVNEFSTHQPVSLFHSGRFSSLRLPIEETPDIRWEQDMKEWACVTGYGAVGDGKTDDTKAIQEAMHSGKKVIWFQPGKYVIDSIVNIPPEVERVNFMYCDLVAGENLKKMEFKGAFKVAGENDTPLLMEDLFAWERWNGGHFLVEHASKRTLILSDIHTQVGSQYINSVSGGKVFIENVCTTDEHHKKKCFVFNGQKVWARQINPERSDPEVDIHNSDVWILGFKTEAQGVSFHLENNARAEIFGGVVNHFSPGKPMVNLVDSEISFFAATRGSNKLDYIISESRNGEVKHLMYDLLPLRDDPMIYIPGYISRNPSDR
ncbi:MAG: glycosyl hydrolase family 28-related protein [Mariniphaga sp.]|nr:glycosyl hydrolase family 28-related protein [Mariniphaga sp.]